MSLFLRSTIVYMDEDCRENRIRCNNILPYGWAQSRYFLICSKSLILDSLYKVILSVVPPALNVTRQWSVMNRLSKALGRERFGRNRETEDGKSQFESLPLLPLLPLPSLDEKIRPLWPLGTRWCFQGLLAGVDICRDVVQFQKTHVE